MRWEKERKEEAEAFSEAQKKRRLKSKTARAAAGKSRAALLTTRAEEAIAMREEKKKLAEFHRQRLQEQYQLRAETVKGACMHPPWTAARRLHHQAARSLLAADRLEGQRGGVGEEPFVSQCFAERGGRFLRSSC